MCLEVALWLYESYNWMLSDIFLFAVQVKRESGLKREDNLSMEPHVALVESYDNIGMKHLSKSWPLSACSWKGKVPRFQEAYTCTQLLQLSFEMNGNHFE